MDEKALALIAAVTYRNECEMAMIESPTTENFNRFQVAKSNAVAAKLDYEQSLDL